MNDANTFRDRIKTDTDTNKRVITREQLSEISKKFIEKTKRNLGNTVTNIEVNLEDVLLRCKESVNDGEKYIIKPQQENNKNLAKIIPLEEFALKTLFDNDGITKINETIVLLEDEKIKLKWNGRHDVEETIEISFHNIEKGQKDLELEF